jgi:predicted HicB family RNase H-like nuclease
MKLKDLLSNKNAITEVSHEPEEEIKEYSLDLREENEGEGDLNKIINLRISEVQFKQLRTKAADAKTSVSDFIRGKLFK